VTYTEFLEWLEFLQWDDRQHGKADHYMAQIAAEIRRANVKNPGRVKIQDFLFQWREVTAAERKSEASKKAWTSALKINLQKN
jgi:hypothetical protein